MIRIKFNIRDITAVPSYSANIILNHILDRKNKTKPLSPLFFRFRPVYINFSGLSYKPRRTLACRLARQGANGYNPCDLPSVTLRCRYYPACRKHIRKFFVIQRTERNLIMLSRSIGSEISAFSYRILEFLTVNRIKIRLATMRRIVRNCGIVGIVITSYEFLSLFLSLSISDSFPAII